MTYSLLLTASIEPTAKNINIHRSDPQVRLSDYKSALMYWLQYDCPSIKAIVFIDNSLYDLSVLRQTAVQYNNYNREVEFLQMKASPLPLNMHYGYSELEMIDYACLESTCLNKYSYFIKTTGRLYFPKLKKLIQFNEKRAYNIISDSRDFKFFRFEKHYVLTTLLIIKFEFYKEYLFDTKQLMIEKKWGLFEILYYHLLKNKANTLLRFPFNVNAVGVGAHWKKDYTSYQQTAISVTRGFLRRFFPTIKI